MELELLAMNCGLVFAGFIVIVEQQMADTGTELRQGTRGIAVGDVQLLWEFILTVVVVHNLQPIHKAINTRINKSTNIANKSK